jgi:hypothetical protein
MGALIEQIRKSSPAGSDMRTASPLTNMTIATLQDAGDFVLETAAPILPVDHRSGTFYVYTNGAFNREEMRVRGLGESEGGGFSLTSDTYATVDYCVHHDVDEDDIDDADPMIDALQDSADWGANQIRMKGDRLFLAACFAASKWGVDLTGTDSTPTLGTSVLKLGNSTADPVKDMEQTRELVRARCGKMPNVIVPGRSVHSSIMSNAVVRDLIKYVDIASTSVIRSKLADLFGVDEYIVPGGFSNTAAEGQTVALADILTNDGLWMGYVNPNIGMKTMTAVRTFGWRRGGRAPNGISTKRFYIEKNKCYRSEFSFHALVKIINSDAGAFITDYV